jgi:hypothetical protein
MGHMFTVVIRTLLVSACNVAKLLVIDEKFSENNEGQKEKKPGRN